MLELTKKTIIQGRPKGGSGMKGRQGKRLSKKEKANLKNKVLKYKARK